MSDEDQDGVFCDGQNCAICARKPQASEQTIEAVLREFEAAASELDAKRLEAIFLPPDDTLAGQARRKHIEEAKRDWPRFKRDGIKMSLRFVDAEVKPEGPDGVVSATTVLRDVLPNGDIVSHEIDVHLRLVRTPEGRKIAEMRKGAARR